jgi:AcrR family transcriptional regulator
MTEPYFYGEPRPARGPRRRLAPEDRKRALVVAALRLFQERPYDQVSVDDIAAEADMSRPLLYHYYGGKLGVFLAALRQAADELLDGIRTAAERSPRTWLSSGVAAYLDHIHSDPIAFVALVGHGSSPAGGESEPVIARAREAILDLIMMGLRASAEPPMLRSVVRGWIGLVEVVSRQWLQTGQPERAELERILLDLFDATLKTTARGDSAVREAISASSWD